MSIRVADPASLQARRDRELRAQLLAESDVQYALKKVDDACSGWGFVSRRQLLAGALRLTRSMAPEVADCLQECRRVLGYDHPVEIYVRPDPVFNAAALKGLHSPHIIVLSSRLVEAFSPDELRFVVGHELGHMVLDHFAIPMPATAAIEDMAGRMVSHANALRLYVWCRSAEISADRLGLLCASDPKVAARGFFKLASGLSSPRVEADLEAYATQVESLASTPEARAKPKDDDETLDCFSTHPYSPLRVRAVVAFSKSRTYRQLTGAGDHGLADDYVEGLVERDLAIMEPSYLEQTSDEAKRTRRLLYCAGVSVAAANGKIEESEVRALRALLGADEMWGELKPDAAREELSQLAVELRDLPLERRAQVVQHLTIIAAADGNVDEQELAEMGRIAGILEVDPAVIEQTLNAAASPMD